MIIDYTTVCFLLSGITLLLIAVSNSDILGCRFGYHKGYIFDRKFICVKCGVEKE